MKGFGIYVKNDLLDTKHWQEMGVAIWLYLWLLDKITSVSEDGIGLVLGGKPIKHEEIVKDIAIPRATYQRYLATLEAAGYVSTTRTPYGLVIRVHKARKIFNNHKLKSETSGMQRDVAKVRHLLPENDTSLPENDTSNKTRQLDKTEDITTNVVRQATDNQPGTRNTQIDLYFDYWQSATGLAIQSQRQKNRYACSNLLKKHGPQRLKQLIDGVALAQADRYAPRISDFIQLQAKTTDLLVWGRQRGTTTGKVVSL